MADHPYRGIPDHQFWNRAVTWAPPGALDPVVHTKFQVTEADQVGTMGSCFAQHLARHLSRSGIDYFVPETAPESMTPDEADRHHYGVFSARYGNVYTVAQAVQLFERAYGTFVPDEGPWQRGDVVVDPFRPIVEPGGFADEAALLADRERHLAAVRSVFEDSDVIVFTLGLTEAWRSRSDGAVFATAPGVNGGSWDPELYEFVNYGIDEVRADLRRYCELAQSVNPDVRILLTVSPVPLIATYEDRHVLVSTTWSKSVLRVAAEDAMQRYDFVDYFPSYELISSASAPRNYFAPDLREVEEIGVSHVMRTFTHHYLEGRPWSAAPAASVAPSVATSGPDAVICDEETIAAAIQAST
ncbi:MAG: GSCFA domain-containing protein [Aquihabitans sp.]